jgi:16S rRNA (guanine527-N7)-methyltransferase
MTRHGVKPRRRPTATKADERSTWNGVDPQRLLAAEAMLRAGLSELALDPRPDQIDALLRLATLLERWAQRANLSSHRDVESIVARLILDAAALSQCLPLAATLVDLGSGAGFPGLPIAVLRPESAVLLVEAREKRHHFQRAAVRELGLRNVEMLCGRVSSSTAAARCRNRSGHGEALASAALDEAVGTPRRLAPASRWRAPAENRASARCRPGTHRRVCRSMRRPATDVVDGTARGLTPSLAWSATPLAFRSLRALIRACVPLIEEHAGVPRGTFHVERGIGPTLQSNPLPSRPSTRRDTLW